MSMMAVSIARKRGVGRPEVSWQTLMKSTSRTLKNKTEQLHINAQGCIHQICISDSPRKPVTLETNCNHSYKFSSDYASALSPSSIYLLKVNNRNTRTRCEICSKLTIKTPERRKRLVLVFLLLTLNMQLPDGSCLHHNWCYIYHDVYQLVFTCLKLTKETVEQGIFVVLVSLFLTLNIFHTLF